MAAFVHEKYYFGLDLNKKTYLCVVALHSKPICVIFAQDWMREGTRELEIGQKSSLVVTRGNTGGNIENISVVTCYNGVKCSHPKFIDK